jgi:hypothetical protein
MTSTEAQTETETETQTASANLRATRKEAAAKKAPAKATTKGKPAEKAAETKTAGAKLRWLIETDHGNGKTQTARVGDRVYEIKKTGEKTYTATVTVDGGAAEVLSETTFAKAYAACVAAHRSTVAA